MYLPIRVRRHLTYNAVGGRTADVLAIAKGFFVLGEDLDWWSRC
jgi:hypothetical protein